MEKDNMEEMVDSLGGCGRFQWLTTIIIHTGRIINIFSLYAMVFIGQQPDFYCDDGGDLHRNDTDHSSSWILYNATMSPDNGIISNVTAEPGVSHITWPISNVTDVPLSTGLFNNECPAECASYVFQDNMKTIANEWMLVCDRRWITATITTIQMTGALVGCFVAGHLADHFGRKIVYFSSLVMMVVVNVLAIFSTGWQMYAVARFIIGMGCGFYLTVQYNLALEFVPRDWRARIVAIPAFSVAGGLFAVTAWALQDWKHLHLATAATGLPFLFTCGIIQESVRWLITKNRIQDADVIVGRIARMNRRTKPTLHSMMSVFVVEGTPSHVGYTVLDLFKSWSRTRRTLSLLFAWMSISYSYYGLTFGVSSLSGNLYLNIFLMNMIDAPVSLSTMYLMNRFGRKKCCIVGFLLTGMCGIIVGTIQYVDTPHRGAITNAFALASKMGNVIGWGCLMVYSTELYPTVVRSISYGLFNTSARIGSMIAPQLVFLNELIPGVMYVSSAVVLITSALLFIPFPETKDQALADVYENQEETCTPAPTHEYGKQDESNNSVPTHGYGKTNEIVTHEYGKPEKSINSCLNDEYEKQEADEHSIEETKPETGTDKSTVDNNGTVKL